MSKASMALEALPEGARRQIEVLGGNLRTARLRRSLSQDELARLAKTSRYTIQRIEKGDPAVSIGIIAHVLWILQLDDLERVGDPSLDEHGLALSVAALPKRVKSKDDRYDF